MKKYDKYYPASVRVTKRKPRKKSSSSFFKIIFLFILFVLFCGGVFLLAKKAYAAVAASRLGTWTPHAVLVSGAEGTLAKELYAAAEEKLKAPFSTRDAVRLQHELVQKYPQLRTISVKRGLLSGKIKINIKKRVPLAQFHVSDGSVLFIDEDGTVYADKKPDRLRFVPSVELQGQVPIQLSQEWVDLIDSTLKLKKQLSYEKLYLNLIDNTVDMLLPDQCEIYFGQATNLRQKAQRAAQIESLAQDTQPHPHVLDFTYFDEGKVFLRQKAR